MQFCTFRRLYNLRVITHSQPNSALRIWRDRAWSTNSRLSEATDATPQHLISGRTQSVSEKHSVPSIGDNRQSQRRCNSNCGKSSLLDYEAVSIIRRRFGQDGNLCVLGLHSPSSFSASLPGLLGPKERRQQDSSKRPHDTASCLRTEYSSILSEPCISPL